MKIHFHIRYKTAPGQNLCAVAFIQTHPESIRQVLTLKPEQSDQWTAQADIALSVSALMTYAYYVMEGGKIVRREWSIAPRQLWLNAEQNTCHIYDWWRDTPAQSWLYSDVFSRKHTPEELAHFERTIVLHAYIPGLSEKQTPFICGATAALGNWDPQQAVALTCVGDNEWAVALDGSALTLPAEYKFILKTEDGSVQWELDANRKLSGYIPEQKETIFYTGLTPHFTLPPARKAGVIVPLFSLRTETDWGNGDFGSLKKWIDWAALTGQQVIQLLPLNDTQDACPYNSVSAYALHPMYVDPAALPPLLYEAEDAFQTKRTQLNQLTSFDYQQVIALKKERLEVAYKQEGKQILASAEFKKFWNKNMHWLPAYAMFCSLRDKFNSADWKNWPNYSQFSEQAMRTFFAQPSQERGQAYFYFYVQFTLHKQLEQAHHYAHSKGVCLKGEIPFNISPDCADAWMNPDLFQFYTPATAGNWSPAEKTGSFVTYNWETMAQDGYDWWKKRLAHFSDYFDAYCLDHVEGFFRTWQIPEHATQSILGHFSPALPLSEQEIRDFGFDFQPRHAQPYITEDFLQELFGNKSDTIRYTYLMPEADNRYSLLPLYNTQQKIKQSFAGTTDAAAKQLQEGLCTLCANVLFVPDQHNPKQYHPRIHALQTNAFSALAKDQQAAYEQLYNDYFFHRQNNVWKKQALQILPVLVQTSSMLCCAEDISVSTSCITEVLAQLQLVSMEVQRLPKQPDLLFADTNKYPYLSVATPSTPDMSVLRGWWEEDRAKTKQFWHEVLERKGSTPKTAPADACEQILSAHLQSPSMLCLIAWQDWASMDEQLHTDNPKYERINNPADPKHSWLYRMPLSLEELLNKTDFNEKIKNMIQQTGR